MSYFFHNASFRDSDARIVNYDGKVVRVIYDSYKDNYQKLENSGLLKELQDEKLLVSHVEVNDEHLLADLNNSSVFKIIKPDIIPFISYPYEWSFSQLKAAALLTLDIQLKAIKKGLSLKDATAFNIQILNGKSIFIDTTSFEIYKEGSPWVAYKQFCQHFLSPLLFYKYNNHSLVKLLWSNIDGIPLNAISKALPYSSKFNFFVWTHIHYHAKLESKYNADSSVSTKNMNLSKSKLEGFLLFLKSGIENIKLPSSETEWSNYYNTFSYSNESFDQKKNLVKEFILEVNSKHILDIGCNEGEFSILASKYAKEVVAVDFDYLVVEKLTRALVKLNILNITPLVVDFSNPTPSIGWANSERQSFYERSKFDTVLALAVIHHLAIGNNVPLSKIAELFASLCHNLVIEFVPKSDPQTQKLLITKKDIFHEYTLDHFKNEFNKYFSILRSEKINESERILFLMVKNA